MLILAARVHPADRVDARTFGATLEHAEVMLDLVVRAPTPEDPAEMIADKGFDSRGGLKALENSAVEEPNFRAGAESFRPVAW